MLSIDDLVEHIRQLSPGKRSQLLSRLRINGLLDFDEALTDQDPLNVATALGIDFSNQSAAKAVAKTVGQPSAEAGAQSPPLEATAFDQPSNDRPTNNQPTQAEHPLGEEGKPPTIASVPESGRIDLTKGKHMAPSSGKVVVGAPIPSAENPQPSDDPHAMAPVPGQGPAEPLKLVFDGGSKGNPGYGYGSYSLEWPGLPPQIVRLQHGNSVTNNEAEYDTLVKALEGIVKRIGAMGVDTSTVQIDIRGDSLLVINQVLGEWKCKHDRLKRRRDKIRIMLDQFEYWELRHHDRENSVRILGH